MSDTEFKSENSGNESAARSDVWQPNVGETVASAGLEPTANLSLRSHRHEAEVHAISSALRQTGGNRKRAAKLLSISYRSLLYKIRQHNISPAALAG
ncbi:MAG: helix-turn-helix domain-containing protein [Candidatus Sulfotelmatobacter sp.]